MPSCLDAALAYAARGFRVFPLLPNSKLPATPHGCKDATTDLETVRRLFTGNPGNIGIATGQGLVVVDLDVKPDRDGLEAWRDLCASHETIDTVECLTPSGGRHLYFRCHEKIANSASKLGPGIDVRGEGGYVVAPPSVIDGKAYAWELSNPPTPVDAPAWLVALLTEKPKKVTKIKEGVIPPGTQDDELHKLACALTRQGLTPETIRAGLRTALLACPQDPAHPFTEADVERWMAGARKLVEETPEEPKAWEAFHLPSQKRQVVCNANTALAVMEQSPLFKDTIWFDSFYARIFTNWETTAPRPWRDDDTARLLVYFQRQVELHKMARSSVEDALNVFVQTHTRHAVQDWIKTLMWDGLPRLEMFCCQGFGAPATPYIYAASKNFWLSLMARIYLPGCQSDHMLVLEGPQGEGKTSALRVLGGSWYLSCSESVMHKDFFQALPGHLIVEIAELDSFRRAELTRIKQVVSTPSDHYRPSYGRQSVTYHRQCIFVGTTNEDDYLKDMTGGRRFWPVPCGKIDLPLLTAQRDQLFAEAAALFRKGATWWEMPDNAKEEQESRREVDVWETPIAEFLLLHDGDVTMKDVLCEACQVPLGQADMRQTKRAGAILRKLGWKRTVVRRGDALLRVWNPPAREPGEDLHTGDFAVEA